METQKQTDNKEPKALTSLSSFNIKIEALTRTKKLEIDIKTTDPCDAMILSGRIIETMRYIMKLEPKSLVMP